MARISQGAVNRVQSMQGFQYGVLLSSANGGDGQVLTFAPDQVYQLQEVRFASTAALDAETVRIEANGEQVYGGQQVPLGLLNSVLCANAQAPAAWGLIIWRPEVPIEISRDRPLRLTNPGTGPGANISVAVHAISLGVEARP